MRLALYLGKTSFSENHSHQILSLRLFVDLTEIAGPVEARVGVGVDACDQLTRNDAEREYVRLKLKKICLFFTFLRS